MLNSVNMEKSTWIERLKFYTSDFTKYEAKQLVSYITWVKCEGLIKEGEEIKKLIDAQDESAKLGK